MKKILLFSVFILIGLGLCLPISLVDKISAQQKSWYFESWDSDITIRKDSTMTIVETHQVNFIGSFHWINRDLVKTKGIWYKFKSVKDQYGKDYNYSLEENSSQLSIKTDFSAENENKTFIYEYEVYNAIGDFENYDELYWNVVSSERDVEIQNASATIHLPAKSKKADLRQRIYLGEADSTNQSKNYQIIDEQTLNFYATNIPAYENFTIVAGWTDGLFKIQKFYETPWQEFWFYFRWVWWFSPVILLILMLVAYFRYGRDPAGRGSIPPEFEPPEKLRPAEIGVLIDENADLRDITSTIVDLAVRGYLEIYEEKKESVLGFGNGKTYKFKKLTKTNSDLLEYEKKILGHLFENKEEVTLDDLKDKFYTHIKDINNGLYQEVVDKKAYFLKRPDYIRWTYVGIGIGLFFIATFLGFLIWPLILIAHGAIIFAFAWAMPKKTKAGVLALEKSKGFKLFLSKTETEKMKLIDHPKWFEQYLPYAMIFGVEKAWAKKFESIYREPPNWYHGYSGTFSSSAFASGFSQGMNSTVGATLASSPSSGGGGFGGGGGAGGGGGGGGSSAG